jgi:uncharacterized membrane protein
MLQPNYPNDTEYRGSIKKVTLGNIIVGIISAIVLLCVAYICYESFTNYENGKTIKMTNLLFGAYKIGGKWPIIVVIVGLAGLTIKSVFSNIKNYKNEKNT